MSVKKNLFYSVTKEVKRLLPRESMRTSEQVWAAFHRAKSEYYSKALEDRRGNGRDTWKVLRELVPDAKKKNVKLTVNDGDDTESTTHQAENFNNIFATVGKDTFLKFHHNPNNSDEMSEAVHTNVYHKNNSDGMFRPEPTTWETITFLIKHMKNTNSHGSDGIPLRYLKDFLSVIISCLTCIINTSIATGIITTAWKHSVLAPMFKSDNEKEPQNYCPIFLLPIVAKVLEKSHCISGQPVLRNKSPPQ